MGIQGLLPLLKSIMVPIHIKDLTGSRVAVDTYSWLHKGALSCSRDLCHSLPTSRHIEYCMHRVNLLRHNGIKPILVFDGGHLPMKNEEEIKRARSRKENFERAIEHEALGNTSAAYDCYQKAVDISPEVAYELIQVLKKENVEYIVAPYEADAQMTFLAITNQVDAVITEDSDLIPFGCPKIIFKMDKFGQAVQFEYSALHQNREMNFTGFTRQMLLEMCILSGCDYLPSLPGMGLKRAYALINKFKSYDKVIKHLRYNIVSVPPLYEESFKKALWAFQHQRVYDPVSEDIVHLRDIPYDLGDDLDFLGPALSRELAQGIAKGDVNPITKVSFQVDIVHSELLVDRLYPLKDFKPDQERKQLALPAQKNILTNYFCSASVQAKRKFKAPRVSLKPLDPTEGSSPISDVSDSKSALVDDSQSFESASRNSRTYDRAVPLELSKHAVSKPCPTLHREAEYKLLSDGVGEKTRTVPKKVIVRSSYFQHKVSKEKDVEDESEDLLPTGVLCEDNVTRSALVKEDELKSSIKKRKSNTMARTQNESVKVKCNGSDRSLTNVKDDVESEPMEMGVNEGKLPMEMGVNEGKFASNISHLNSYSDVAEKSMEKFVSVISSFKCTSSASGSRASGLRAPLKDVQNMFRTRSVIAPLDLSKFSYKASNQKTVSATLRN